MTAWGSSTSPVRHVYYPMRHGVAVTSAYLAVDGRRFAIRDLCQVGRLPGRRRGTWQLWGRYRGEVMLLWVCRDETEFGQVCRALLRSVEAHCERSAY